MDKLDKIIKENQLINTSEIKEKNISKTKYYDYLKINKYEKVGPGFYVSNNEFVDYLFLIHKRSPYAVISHDEALYFYGLIDREPLIPTFTIYSGYNASRLKKYGYKVFYIKKELLYVGKEDVCDFNGNIIPMYDIERTICDLIRNRSYFEIQDFNTALKNYVKKPNKNIKKLFEYAELFGIEKILKNYLEVLL